MFRLLFWALLLYFGFRLLKGLLVPEGEKKAEKVQGNPKTDPLDLSKADVEDAVFREIDDRKSRQPK